MMQTQEKPEEKSSAAIIVLARDYDVELRHHLLGQVLRRVKEFAAKYDTDGKPQVVTRAVEWDFAQDAADQKYLTIVAVRGLEVIGHLLCHVFEYYGNRWVVVQQFELDEESGITLEQERQAFRAVVAWQNKMQAVGIRAVAPSPVHLRRLRMLHGFKVKQTMMTFGDSNG